MKTLILYYSLTGTTAKVANSLGTELNAQIEEIKCPRYQTGLFGYLRAGIDSIRGRLPQIDVQNLLFEEFDLIIFGAPIWTSYPALPLRSFLADNPQLPDHIALFLTCGGQSPPDNAVEVINSFLPTPLIASVGIAHDQVVENAYSHAIDTFVAELNATDW